MYGPNMGKSFLALTVVLVACSSHHRPAVFKQDVDAWIGVPVIELETHPFFSAKRRKTQTLSDGSEMWTFSHCLRYVEDTECRSAPAFGQVVTNCSGGNSELRCCYSSFRIADKKVVSHGLSGDCVTSCSNRPESNPCSASEEEEHR